MRIQAAHYPAFCTIIQHFVPHRPASWESSSLLYHTGQLSVPHHTASCVAQSNLLWHIDSACCAIKIPHPIRSSYRLFYQTLASCTTHHSASWITKPRLMHQYVRAHVHAQPAPTHLAWCALQIRCSWCVIPAIACKTSRALHPDVPYRQPSVCT